jgi:hypothetical protein
MAPPAISIALREVEVEVDQIQMIHPVMSESQCETNSLGSSVVGIGNSETLKLLTPWIFETPVSHQTEEK